QLIERQLGSSRFYLRPYRKAAELGRLGYDEVGFYSLADSGPDTVNIFATVKEESGAVWIAPIAPPSQRLT
ncbi:MAG: hypothetical protein HY303_08820, partial [Candidatus Wallbacteria bacterium]|nr:hypothetical protein [Candidatus Wallbacteria bacterium]